MRKCFIKTNLFIIVMIMAAVFLVGCAGSESMVDRGKASGKAPLEAEIIEDAAKNYKKAHPGAKGSDTPSEEQTETASPVIGKAPSPVSGRASTGSSRDRYGSTKVFGKKPAATRNISRAASLSNAGSGPEEEGQIIFNFDDADLYEVIKTMAELLEINYIVDPGIQGKVTIHTARKLKKTDLFPVFSQILELNGLAVMKEGKIYKIIPMKDTPRMPMDALFTLGQKGVPPMDRVIIQIIPLKYMSVEEMTKLLTPFLSSGGTIVVSASTNTLVVVDKGANILKILQLVGTFDINVLDRVYYRFYPLEYLEAKEVSEIMKEFTTSYAKDSTGIVKFIALERLNTLLAVSTIPDVFDKIEELVRQIDIVDETVAARIFVYFVKNGSANELATLLNNVLTGKETQKQAEKKAGGSSDVKGNPFSMAKMAEKKAEKAAAKAGESTRKATEGKKASGASGEGSGTLMGDVTITPDEIRNALIIEATPADYKIINGILKQIDIMPRQVLIEATIAEITLDSSTLVRGGICSGSGGCSGQCRFYGHSGSGRAEIFHWRH